MSELKRPEFNFMKYVGFIMLLCVISIAAIGGCSNNGGSGGDTKALTEFDFSEDSSVIAQADDSTVVNFLERPGTEMPEKDTGEVGTDIIPYRYDEPAENTFCWEDDNLSASHSMTLIDSQGAQVLSLETNGQCVTELIEQGDYEMILQHDGISEDPLVIFIQSAEEEEELGSNREEGILGLAKTFIKETIGLIGTGYEARAQLPLRSDIDTLISTGNCVNCRLTRANLNGADLSGTNLEGSNLFSAKLSGANLTQSNLAGTTISNVNMAEADLTEANLTGASLLNTDLTGANLTFANLNRAGLGIANLTDANLTGANLTSADLTNTNLRRATLTRANLSGANLFLANLRDARLLNANLIGTDFRDANLNGATWCDGMCVCSPGSVGVCQGCPSQDTCTGPQ